MPVFEEPCGFVEARPMEVNASTTDRSKAAAPNRLARHPTVPTQPGTRDPSQLPARAPPRVDPVDTASFISRQWSYCAFFDGEESSYPCSQKRNQSRFRS